MRNLNYILFIFIAFLNKKIPMLFVSNPLVLMQYIWLKKRGSYSMKLNFFICINNIHPPTTQILTNAIIAVDIHAKLWPRQRSTLATDTLDFRLSPIPSIYCIFCHCLSILPSLAIFWLNNIPSGRPLRLTVKGSKFVGLGKKFWQYRVFTNMELIHACYLTKFLIPLW